MLDRTLAREILKANGDGGRDAKFALLGQIRAAQKALSTPNVIRNFNEVLASHGRVPVAICVAVTVLLRADTLRHTPWMIGWALDVMSHWTNRPAHPMDCYIDDNLHPTRIVEYAGSFVRLTSEPD